MSTTLDAEVVDDLGVEGGSLESPLLIRYLQLMYLKVIILVYFGGYSEKNICFGHDIAIFHKKRDEEYI